MSNRDHVKLPHEGAASNPQHKWHRIKNALSKPIHSLEEFSDVLQETAYISSRDLSSYVQNTRANGQNNNKSDSLDTSGLRDVIAYWKQNDSPEVTEWRISTIQRIQGLVLSTEQLFPIDPRNPHEPSLHHIPLVDALKIDPNDEQSGAARVKVTMSRAEIACILANAFFCTMPFRSSWKKNGTLKDYHIVNFVQWYEKLDRRRYDPVPIVAEKLTFLLVYFASCTQTNRLDSEWHKERVTFIRNAISPNYHFQDTVHNPLSEMHVVNGMGMEDYPSEEESVSCVDFANQCIGGGVLDLGCVQEEILFLIHPECLASMFFMRKMLPNEAIIIRGVRRFSNYKGYGATTRYVELNEQQGYALFQPCDWQRPIEFLAIDAVSYNSRDAHTLDQYTPKHYWRDITKCAAGFYPVHSFENSTIATGNWGCGVFRGDPQFKFALQLLVASAYGRKMLYFPFNNKDLEQLESTYESLQRANMKVGDLLNLVEQFSNLKQRRENAQLSFFDFVAHTV